MIRPDLRFSPPAFRRLSQVSLETPEESPLDS